MADKRDVPQQIKGRIRQKVTRRRFLDYSLAATAGLAVSLSTGGNARLGGVFAGNANAVEIGDDGLHKQSWFIESFLDLRDDLKDAQELGKHLAIIWEQRGCPYCGEMHRVNLAKPEVNSFIEKNFHVLQLDFRGSRIVTDFDGKELSEQALAARWRVTGTPSVIFFPDSPAKHAKKSGHDVEIWRLLGYWKPYHFISNFEYVQGGHYKTKKFHKFLDEKTARLKASGQKPDIWN